jgi:hypothetical protein
MKVSNRLRRSLILSFLVVALAAGSVAPVLASGPFYAEAPMQVMAKGLTVEQHLARQAALSQRLADELPSLALNKAVRIPFAADEASALDKASRSESPLRIGVVKEIEPIVVAGLDPDSLSKAANGRLVWATVLRADDAGAIRLHVEGMSLPRNAELFLYSRDGQAYGPYTGVGPNKDGEFWTATIFGPEAILQLRLPADADLQKVSFKVGQAGLITENFARSIAGTRPMPWEKAFCGNIACILDASCNTNTPAEPEKLAIAKMEWISGAFIYTCTGGLLSDTNPTQGNFFLTANHCLSATKTAKTVNFYWRFATSACNATCPTNTGWPYITTGASVASSNRKGDYTLMQLTQNPPAGSVFLGWTSAPVASTNGAHLYRVSNPHFGPMVYSAHDVDTGAPTCTGWPRGERIYSRDVTGAIDGGSSGSPVVNASSQVVGQLSGTCGTNSSDACASGPGEANATVDGAFAYYFATIKPFINP